MKTKSKLGQKVKCSGYLIKAKDGVHLYKKGDKYIAYADIPKDIETDTDRRIVSELKGLFDNDYEPNCYYLNCGEWVDKKYYDIKDFSFNGIIVDKKKVIVKGIIGIDYGTTYGGGEYEYFYKQPTEIIECYKVYYAMGKSRLVPINKAEEI